MSSLKQQLLTRARKLAGWFAAGQVDRPSSADCGRYVDRIDVRGGRGARIGEPVLTTNWTTGMTVIAMLMAWKRTGEKRYRESARSAGEYLKSLQITDARDRKTFGMIREVTPQTRLVPPARRAERRLGAAPPGGAGQGR